MLIITAKITSFKQNPWKYRKLLERQITSSSAFLKPHQLNTLWTNFGTNDSYEAQEA